MRLVKWGCTYIQVPKTDDEAAAELTAASSSSSSSSSSSQSRIFLILFLFALGKSIATKRFDRSDPSSFRFEVALVLLLLLRSLSVPGCCCCCCCWCCCCCCWGNQNGVAGFTLGGIHMVMSIGRCRGASLQPPTAKKNNKKQPNRLAF